MKSVNSNTRTLGTLDRVQGHVGNLRKAFDEHSGDARDIAAESELSPTISQSGI